MMDYTANQLIDLLRLTPHPEGGFYRETHRDPVTLSNGRSCATAIYFLLRRGERSRWHRVDATEIWHWYAGAPLNLWQSPTQGKPQLFRLGQDIADGAEPQCIVPAGYWQSAATTGDYTLVGCTVSPGFEFSGFEMAGPEFEP